MQLQHDELTGLHAAVFSFQFCKCLPGLRMVDVPAVNGTLSTKRCEPAHTAPVLLITVSTISSFLAVAAVLALAAAWAAQHRHALGPPGDAVAGLAVSSPSASARSCCSSCLPVTHVPELPRSGVA